MSTDERSTPAPLDAHLQIVWNDHVEWAERWRRYALGIIVLAVLMSILAVSLNIGVASYDAFNLGVASVKITNGWIVRLSLSLSGPVLAVVAVSLKDNVTSGVDVTNFLAERYKYGPAVVTKEFKAWRAQVQIEDNFDIRTIVIGLGVFFVFVLPIATFIYSMYGQKAG